MTDRRMIRKRGRLWFKTVLCLTAFMAGCSPTSKLDTGRAVRAVDLQGHRGARGLVPENTIPSFLMAVDLGVDTIELDVGVTSDEKVIVSHEPWFSHEICSKPDDSPVTEAEAQQLNMYQMTYAEVTHYDCGTRGNERFPKQQRMAVSKPLLSDVIVETERRVAESGRKPVAFNVEIKSKEEGDGIYHPAPDSFARLVYNILQEKGVLDRTTIQSFDPRAIEAVHLIDPNLTVALLVDNDLGFEKNLERLSFRPAIYSPNHRLVDKSLVTRAHAMGVTVVPWTVNDEETMRSLLDLGVDGLITDYPDIGRRVVDATR